MSNHHATSENRVYLALRPPFTEIVQRSVGEMQPKARRTPAGYRVYDEIILQRIQFIKIRQMLGFKRHELPALMGDGESLDHHVLLQQLDVRQLELEHQIARLQSNNDRISQLKQELTNTWRTGT